MAARTLASMLEAQTVAVIGASARPGSFGEQMMVQLDRGGFDGRVFPVNPRYEEVLGCRCFPSIGHLPEPVDLAVIGVANARLEEQLLAAAKSGARSAAIFASCYEEPAEGVPPLTERLAAIAREAEMAVCGGNAMGFVNLDRRLRVCGFSMPDELPPGGVTFISHSGSAFSALLHNDRQIRFNLVVSAGNELATTTAEYLAYALELDTTSVVALFLETVRDPGVFRAALERAVERDVPVVALKVGREPRARPLVAAHSGALAGEDGAYEALFDAYGVIRVWTLDELADSVELMAAGRRAGPGALAAIHDSGGERAHLIDVAAEERVPLMEVGDETRARLESLLEEGLPAVNPLDAWGTGNEAEAIYVGCMRALMDDPGAAALAFCVDLTTEADPGGSYVSAAQQVWGTTEKPMAVMSNLSAAIDRDDVARLRGAGIPVLEGTATGLRAFRHVFEYRDARARPPVERGPFAADEVRDRWRGRLHTGGPMTEAEGLTLLREYGVPVVAFGAVASADEAAAVAERIGWPVALKTAARGVAHKSGVGGVWLGLADEQALRAAYDALDRTLGPQAVVAAMAPAGVELAFGVVRDAQFGPMVMIAAGGVLVEALRDRRFGLPPLDRARARTMLDTLAVRPLLDGRRGSAGADLEAIERAVAALSRLAEDLGDLIDALDANPVICGPDGCVAVDALIVPRGASA